VTEWNSSLPYTDATLDALRESIGVPQFSGATSENWAFVFNGMIFQGGKISVPAGATAFDFPAPLTQQVLGVFLQTTVAATVYVSATTLNTFTVTHAGATHDVYWWAIGV